MEITTNARQNEPMHIATSRAGHIMRCTDSFELHSKTKALNAASNAIRPRSAITGLGERKGSVAAQQLDQKPYAKAKGHERLMLQLGIRPLTADAAVKKGPTDIWPLNMQQNPPRFCVGCRGQHEQHKERNQSWQPYTLLQRFENLGLLESAFQTAFRQGKLPCTLAGANEPIRWLGVTPQGKVMKPINLDEMQYKQLLPVLFEGVREGHEPYRYLASQAATELLAVAADPPATAQCKPQNSREAKSRQPPQAGWLLEIVPEVVAAVKLGLNTMQPSLAAQMLSMLQQLLQANSCIGPAMVPFYKQLLPAMALLARHSKTGADSGLSKRLLLPAPCCLPAVGSFASGQLPAGSASCCAVCGAAFGSALQIKVQHQQQLHREARPQEGVCGQQTQLESCTPPLFGGEIPAVHATTTFRQRRVAMLEILEETLQLMVEVGGGPGLAVVKQYWPTYDYCNPQD